MKALVIALTLAVGLDLALNHGAGLVGTGHFFGNMGAAISRGVWAEP